MKDIVLFLYKQYCLNCYSIYVTPFLFLNTEIYHFLIFLIDLMYTELSESCFTARGTPMGLAKVRFFICSYEILAWCLASTTPVYCNLYFL